MTDNKNNQVNKMSIFAHTNTYVQKQSKEHPRVNSINYYRLIMN